MLITSSRSHSSFSILSIVFMIFHSCFPIALQSLRCNLIQNLNIKISLFKRRCTKVFRLPSLSTSSITWSIKTNSLQNVHVWYLLEIYSSRTFSILLYAQKLKKFSEFGSLPFQAVISFSTSFEYFVCTSVISAFHMNTTVRSLNAGTIWNAISTYWYFLPLAYFLTQYFYTPQSNPTAAPALLFSGLRF